MLGSVMGGLVTASQNSRNLSTRCSGGLPAIIAPLMAPIDVPQSQVTSILASWIAWKTPA
jgi:hypothetical protein